MLRILLMTCLVFSASFSQTAGISLEQKIGQMLMISYQGPSFSGERALLMNDQLEAGLIGGLIFFKTNIETKDQFASLMDSILMLDTSYPLLLAVDEEGGKVRRLKKHYGFKETPAAESVAENYTLNEAASVYGNMAEQIGDLGLNLNLAPVVDVNVNANSPVIGKLGRSFSSEAMLVSEYAEVFIDAHHTARVLTCLKHYPGHGSAITDTHDGLTDISGSWQALELEPFEYLIQKDKVDMIMCGHLYHAPTDPDYPASISRKHIDGVLRSTLNYNGVVLSDDLQMGAIIDRYSLEQIIVLAIQAGSDILQFSNPVDLDENFPLLFQSIVLAALERGDIDQEMIQASFDRIIELKHKLTRYQNMKD